MCGSAGNKFQGRRLNSLICCARLYCGEESSRCVSVGDCDDQNSCVVVGLREGGPRLESAASSNSSLSLPLFDTPTATPITIIAITTNLSESSSNTLLALGLDLARSSCKLIQQPINSHQLAWRLLSLRSVPMLFYDIIFIMFI